MPCGVGMRADRRQHHARAATGKRSAASAVLMKRARATSTRRAVTKLIWRVAVRDVGVFAQKRELRRDAAHGVAAVCALARMAHFPMKQVCRRAISASAGEAAWPARACGGDAQTACTGNVVAGKVIYREHFQSSIGAASSGDVTPIGAVSRRLTRNRDRRRRRT